MNTDHYQPTSADYNGHNYAASPEQPAYDENNNNIPSPSPNFAGMSQQENQAAPQFYQNNNNSSQQQMAYNNTLSTMGMSNDRVKLFPSSTDDNQSFPEGTVIMMAPQQNSVQSVASPHAQAFEPPIVN